MLAAGRTAADDQPDGTGDRQPATVPEDPVGRAEAGGRDAERLEDVGVQCLLEHDTGDPLDGGTGDDVAEVGVAEPARPHGRA